MEVKVQLQKLLRIQELALEIRAATAIVAGTAGRIEEIEGRFRERNAEYVALKDRHEEIERDRREREGETAVLRETLKKYTDGLMQVKNTREYAAVLKEIDTVKAQIAGHDDAILTGMAEFETLAADLADRAAHIGEERAAVESERLQVESDAAAANDQILRCGTERAGIESALPADLVDSVRRVEEARQGIFLAKADKESCTACFVRVRPQVFQEIRQAVRIHSCASCRRFLYFEATLRPTASAQVMGSKAPAVEASDGGAI